jgi:hypothetical protein
MGDMWIELLPVSLAAVVVGALVGCFLRRPGAAFLLALATTYLAQIAGYLLVGPVYFDPVFLGRFFLLPSLLSAGVTALIVPYLRSRRGKDRPVTDEEKKR